jgi:hypothetical protein
MVLPTMLREGQAASVLQLPAQPKSEVEAREQHVWALSVEIGMPVLQFRFPKALSEDRAFRLRLAGIGDCVCDQRV